MKYGQVEAVLPIRTTEEARSGHNLRSKETHYEVLKPRHMVGAPVETQNSWSALEP